MAETSTATFGKLLRQFRRNAGLTQEELAERAGLSARAVSDLERGVKQAPHEATIDMLTDALQLSADDREALRGTVSRRRRLPTSRAPLRPRLPAEPTPFVGREREEGEARRLLRWGELRLLTLTGPGGVGKTRLALRVAGAMADEYSDGVAFVSLAPADSPERVIALIAQELDLKEQQSRPLEDTVADYLATREMLLVLDNFEHVMAAAGVVADLLARAPRLRILATSREPLRLRSEQELDVPPLEVPEPAIRSSGRTLLRYPALALFMQRARAARPDFQAGDAEAGIIAEICRRLDGLPLAIELAAPRIKVIGLEGLLQHVEHRLMALTDGPRDLPVRQQTIRNTIQWSYDLLTENEQAAFRRLAVFVGGFDGKAAAAVLPPVRQVPASVVASAQRVAYREDATGEQPMTEDTDDHQQRAHVDRLLVSLVEKSLLRRDPSDADMHYQMLETVREYGLEILTASGESPAVRRSHADFWLETARRADSARKGPQQADWAARLERGYADVRAALRFYRDSGELERALWLAGHIAWFWEMRGRVREGEAWTEELLNAAGADIAPSAVGRCAFAASRFAFFRGDMDRAIRRGHQALEAHHAAGDRAREAAALNLLGGHAHYRTDYEEAARYFGESLNLCRDLGDEWGMTQALINSGLVASQREQFDDAVRYLEEALVLARRTGDRSHYGAALAALALAEERRGDLDRGVTLTRESIVVREEIGDHWGMMISQCNLGDLLRRLGRPDEALAPLRAALRFAADEGVSVGIMVSVEYLGAVAHDLGRTHQAVMMLGSAARLRQENGVPMSRTEREIAEPIREQLRDALGGAAFDATWESGWELPLDAVIALAMGEDESG